MKTPPFLLIGCPVIIVVAAVTYAFTYPAFRHTPFHAALVDARRAAVDVGDTSTNGASSGERAQRMQKALAQLDLSETQKQQIDQIRQTVTDHKQRRDAIMNVLTPDQRTKLKQIREAQRNGTATPPAPAASAGTTRT